MKKITLLSFFLISFLSAALAQQPFDYQKYLHPSDQGKPGSVDERNDFPKLLTDSVSIEVWGNIGNGYQVLNTENSKFYYNNKEQNISQYSFQNEYYTGTQVSYIIENTNEFDLDGRVIRFISNRFDASGNFLTAYKNERNYTGTGSNNYESLEYYQYSSGGAWELKNRNTITTNASQSTNLNEQWDGVLLVWTPVVRSTRTLNAAGNPVLIQNERWFNNDWIITYQSEQTYDAQGNSLTIISSYGSETEPLTPDTKQESTYDVLGQLFKVSTFTWDTSSSVWNLSGVRENRYDANGELKESVDFIPNFFNELDSVSRSLYTQGPGIYSDAPEETLRQIWDGQTQSYLDTNLDKFAYSDLLNGQVLLELDFSNKEIAGQGDWRKNLYGLIYYNRSQLSDTPSPATAQPCTVPNPYSAGFQVQCDQLKTDASYMVWVYDIAGKAVYAKHFKGGEGWSIDRQLNAGTYVAVITQNDRRVASSKIVISGN